MSCYKIKIQKELDKHSRQWLDAICPNVTRFGSQADKEIEQLRAENERLKRDAKRYRALRDSGKYSPGRDASGWGLSGMHGEYSVEQLDAGVDALIADQQEQEG